MFLKKAAALVLGAFVMFGCSEDPKNMEEPVVTTEDSAPASFDENYTPGTIYFAFDDHNLTADAETELNNFANYLATNPGVQVQVEGHCDERGTIEYNLALGEKRAQSVKNYLSNLGVDSSRVMTISYGEEKPVSEGHDEDSWSRNRRAEFVLNSN
jgi:peptidoglycan-associated lipoprotein